MSAFLSTIAPWLSPQGTGNPPSIDATNRSVNVVGNGGSAASLAQLIALSQGPTENGGFLNPAGEYVGLSRQNSNVPLLLIAGVGVVLLVLLLRN